MYYNVIMADLTSFRLDKDMARALNKLAQERGVPKSQIVREAIARYLADPGGSDVVLTVRERSAPYVGAVRLGRGRQDEVSRLIRDHNWRE